MFRLTIFFIILSVLFLIVLTLVILKHRKKEGFVNNVNNDFYDNDHTLPDADATQVNKYGIQRCKALNDNLLNKSTDNYIMVQEFITTNRLKEGKNKNECFFYDDFDKNMQDPLMIDSECDINKPLFKDNLMFKNVYSDKKQDNFHKYPIQKCVMEFEESQINEANLSKFLKVVKDEQCSKIATKFAKELASILKNYTELSIKNASLNKEYSILQNKFNKADRDNKECIYQTGILNRDIISNRSDNDEFIRKASDMYNEYKKCEGNLTNLWYTTSNDISILNKDIENLNSESSNVKISLSKCIEDNNEVENTIQRNITGTIDNFEKNNKWYGANSFLYRSNVDCLDELNKTTIKADYFMNEYNTCFPNIEYYNTCKPTAEKCINDLEDCNSKIVTYSEMYEDFAFKYKTCSNILFNTIQELEECVEKKVALTILNEEYIKNISEQVVLIPDLEGQKKTCLIELSKKTTFNDELKKRNEELRKNKSTIIESCSGVKKEKDENKLKLLKTEIETTYLSNIEQKIQAVKNEILTSSRFDGANTTNRPVIDSSIETVFLSEPLLWDKFNPSVRWYTPFVQGTARDAFIKGDNNPWLEVLSDFPDNSAQWIWGTESFTNSANETNREKQNNPIIHQFQAAYNNNSSENMEVTLWLITDDYGWLYLNYNDTAIHNKNYSHNVTPIKIYQAEKLFKVKVRLNPGRNTITIDAVNKNGIGGGILFTMIDASGKTLINSSMGDFKCHVTNDQNPPPPPPPEEAAPPPPPPPQSLPSKPIIDLMYRQCIDASDNTKLRLRKCDNSKNQNWIREPGIDSSKFVLKNEGTGQCIDGNGTSLYMLPCQHTNQYQNFSEDNNKFKHMQSGMCFDRFFEFGDCKINHGNQNWI